MKKALLLSIQIPLKKCDHPTPLISHQFQWPGGRDSLKSYYKSFLPAHEITAKIQLCQTEKHHTGYSCYLRNAVYTNKISAKDISSFFTVCLPAVSKCQELTFRNTGTGCGWAIRKVEFTRQCIWPCVYSLWLRLSFTFCKSTLCICCVQITSHLHSFFTWTTGVFEDIRSVIVSYW